MSQAEIDSEWAKRDAQSLSGREKYRGSKKHRGPKKNKEQRLKAREELYTGLSRCPGESIEYLCALDYPIYLKSEHWRLTRIALFRSRKRRCEKCNSCNKIRVHHKTYVRRGYEKLSDLQVLCERCHNLTHGYR
jgi:hypothetical protein